MKNKQQLYKIYSEFYDLVYKDSNNHGFEAKKIDAIIKKFFSGKPSSLVDIGCGTGKHAVEFSRLGYNVTGVDASPSMLSRAKVNIKRSGEKVALAEASLPDIKIDKKFDVAISLFDVFNYIKNKDDLTRSLKNIKKFLNKGAILYFIVWNPKTAPKLYRPFVYKLFNSKDISLLKISETNMNSDGDVELGFTYFIFELGKPPRELREDYHMHVFSFNDMKYSLRAAGFKLISISPVFEVDKKLSNDDFRVNIVAKV